MKIYVRYFLIVLCLYVATSIYAQEDAWMPDPNLRKAVRQELGILEGVSLTPADMTKMTGLNVMSINIIDLTGLEHAINLEVLLLPRNRVQDIRPLTKLTKLTFLDLGDNAISDITPLAGLMDLEVLRLWRNQIVDVSPLAGLVNLKELWLNSNQIEDFSPLAGLVNLEKLIINSNLAGDFSAIPTSKLIEFIHDESCNLEGILVSERIENREYPSIFSAWQNIINLPSLSWNERLAYHDLRFAGLRFGVEWRATSEGVKLFGHFESAKRQRDAMLSQNPNMIFLTTVDYYAAHPSEYPADWPHWLRDESGNKIEDVGWDAFLIDFTEPEVYDYFVGQAIEIAKCGLFDGIFLDWWRDDWQDSGEAHYYTFDVSEAAITMLRRIREGVDGIRDDFLIIANTNRTKIPRSAPYVNGTFMETIDGRDYTGLAEMESTLLWSEQNFQYPQINCLEGWADKREPLDSAKNRRWMRVFTTLSLTHSNGYVNFVSGIVSPNHTHLYEIWEGHSIEHARGELSDHTHQHYWYDFWDADLGTPAGGDETKGQLYENREGLFIREYTNGWAVYNRSGKERKIYLPEKVSAVASGVENKHWHTIPDLDGEIFLKKTTPPVNDIKKTAVPADVNNDGKVNIDDIRLVVADIGVDPTATTRADVNEDGTVNVLDLQTVIDNLDNPTTAEAPTLREDLSGTFNAALLRAELNHLGTDAQHFTEAIALLKRLLASTLPEQTLLLANYPNPFNPETWIPYHLANPSNVRITIYDTRGSIVRRLNLGHQREGYYTSRGRAAYWDGRNDVGERVASGIYFYQLQADGLSYLRKMVILK